MQHSRGGGAWDTTPEETTSTPQPDTIEASLPQPVLRSRPIAIRQTATDHDDDDSDDDDDSHHRDEDLEEEEDARTIVHRMQQPQSLPSRLLLRAPHLGSIPTNDETFLLRHGNIPEFRLPEPDTVETTTEKPTAYGSLRDSHMQGRFLDQPRSSFVIGGDRARGASNVMSSSAPIFSGLTIGERIQQQRKLQLALRQKNSGGVAGVAVNASTTDATLPRKSSVLAELLGKMELEQDAAAQPSLTTLDTDPPIGLEPPPLLDTSLSSSVTGLAILQSGLSLPSGQRWTALQKHRSLPPLSNAAPVSTTHSNRLSQSFSSPAAGFLLPPTFGHSSSMHSTPMLPTFESQGFDLPPAPPAHLPPLDAPVAMEEGVEDDDEDQSADMEGAFDLDMD